MTTNHHRKSSVDAKGRLRLSLFLFLSLLSLVVFSSLASATVQITFSNYKTFDAVNAADRYHSLDVKVTKIDNNNLLPGTTSEYGYVEIELSNKAAGYLSFVGSPQICNSGFPYNVGRSYGLMNGESVTYNIKGMNIPDGTYYPLIVHATGCFTGTATEQATQVKQPFGWGANILQGHSVVFGAASGNVADQCDNPATALAYVRAKGDLSCTSAVCNNPATATSEAVCSTHGACIDGALQKQTCGNGDTIIIRECANYQWRDTGLTCPSQTLPPPLPLPGEGGGGLNTGWIFAGVGAGVLLLIFGRKLLAKAGVRLF